MHTKAKQLAIDYVKSRRETVANVENQSVFDEHVASRVELFENILTMCVIDAFRHAQQQGWEYKHYRELLAFVLNKPV